MKRDHRSFNRSEALNSVISLIDPFRAASDLLKPETPKHPARQKFREAVRADHLSVLSLVSVSEAQSLRDRAAGNDDAETQFRELIALKAQTAQRDEAQRVAALSKTGEARARKARIRLGAVLMKASQGAADPYGDAVTWLYGHDAKHRDYRKERRNLERELTRFIEQNARDMWLKAAVGVRLGQVMVMGALVQTRMDAFIADALTAEIKASNNLDFETDVKRRFENGRLFELALAAMEATGGPTLHSADTVQAFRWLASECTSLLETHPAGQPFRPNPLPPLRFKNVFFGELAGGV